MAIPDARWALGATISGLLAIIGYFVALSVPLAGFWWHLNSFSIGILLGCALYGCSRTLRPSIAAELGGLLTLAGGLFMSYMLMQQHVMHELDSTSSQALAAVNNLQLSTDIAFDVFIGVGLILLSLAMLRDPRYGRILGGIGLLTQTTQIVFNLVAFPRNPGSVGLLDVGPIAAVWLVVVFGFSFRLYLNERKEV